MAFLHEDVYKSGLNTISNAAGVVLHICHTEPVLFANVATYTLGNKTSVDIGDPVIRTLGADGSNGGYKVVISAITDGQVVNTGTATHYALVDGTRLLATQTLTNPQVVTAGNIFTLTSYSIGIPGPV